MFWCLFLSCHGERFAALKGSTLLTSWAQLTPSLVHAPGILLGGCWTSMGCLELHHGRAAAVPGALCMDVSDPPALHPQCLTTVQLLSNLPGTVQGEHSGWEQHPLTDQSPDLLCCWPCSSQDTRLKCHVKPKSQNRRVRRSSPTPGVGQDFLKNHNRNVLGWSKAGT